MSSFFPGRNSGLHRCPCTHDVLPLCKLQAGLKLLNISFAASFLVVLAGDVSLNPGPETDHCALCTKGCRKNQRAVQCDECDRWFHAKCINMNHHEYLDISTLAAYRSCMDCLFPNFDVPTRSETWLSSNISDCEVTIPGYTLVRKDRNGSTKLNGGGVLFYIRDNILFTVKKDLATNKEELLWVEINRSKCKPLLIAAAYKPPNVKEANFLETLSNSFAKIDLDKNGLVLMGDFNIDQHGKSSASRLLKSFAVVNDMKQLINEPTRITEYSKTLIDLIFTNREHKIVQSDVIHTTLSDHSLVYCMMKGGIPKIPPKKFECQSFKNYNKSEFIKDLNQVPWSVVNGVENVDVAVLWEKLFSEIANEHAPLKIQQAKESKKYEIVCSKTYFK